MSGRVNDRSAEALTLPRVLVVNADDFGMSERVNRGIVRAHEVGIVTSASLRVDRDAAREAAEYARSHPRLGVGLHVDLGEWVLADGAWSARYEVAPLDDREAIRRAVQRQLDRFRELVDREPTHLDSHQHVHVEGEPRRVLRRLAGRLGVPLRHVTPGVRHVGSFYGRGPEDEPLPAGITVEALLELVEEIEPGVTEIGCHPGEGGDPDEPYDAERVVELRALCDPRVRAAIERAGIALRSFADAGPEAGGAW